MINPSEKCFNGKRVLEEGDTGEGKALENKVALLPQNDGTEPRVGLDDRRVPLNSTTHSF